MPDIGSWIFVVTGANRGIGRAFSNRLAELGQTVIGCGRTWPVPDRTLIEVRVGQTLR